MIGKAALLLSGNAATALLTLVRNLVIARLIPVEDYGIAATFALAMAVVEMASAFGLQQQIVQAQDGDDPRFQAALQGFQLLRGLVAGAALFAAAGPIADFLNLPDTAWAYRVMAAVPVLTALQHFDIHRLNRRMAYGPLVLTGTLPAVAALAAVWPLYLAFGDWRVMLWTILLQAALAALVSHLVAERRFALRLDRAATLRAMRFGWPLLLNGALLFLVLYGDRVMVARLLGMAPLAVFSMGVTLTLTPTLVLDRTTQNLFLPRLSRAAEAGEDGGERFQTLARAALQAAMLNGAALVLGTVVFGAVFVRLTLGEKYADLVPLLVPLAILHAVRVWKTGPAVVALARGQTGNAMLANLPRAAFLPLGWMLLQGGGTLLQLVWLGTLAECLGLAVALVLVRGRARVRLGPHAPALAAGGLFLAVTGALFLLLPGVWPLPVWVQGTVALALFGLLLATLRDLRRAGRLRKGGPPPSSPPPPAPPEDSLP